MAKLSVFGAGLVSYFERPGSPEESYTAGVGKVRRVFDTAWNDRWTFIQGLLGWSQILEGNLGKKYIQRVPPQPYKDIRRVFPNDEDEVSPEQYWLFPTQLESVQGIGPRGKQSNDIFFYEKARITVTYESLTYTPYSDEYTRNKGWLDQNGNPSDLFIARPGSVPYAYPFRYISRSYQPTAEYLTLPYGQLLWADDGSPAATGAGKIIPTMEVHYTWHMVPSSLNNVSNQVTHIFNHVGKVNKYEFDNCPPGTLLLTAVESKPYRLIGGGYLNDLTFKMKYFNATNIMGVPENKGHNHFLKFSQLSIRDLPPGTIGLVPGSTYKYELLSSDGTLTGRRVYDEINFTTLFQIE